jgi:hypothetical protein
MVAASIMGAAIRPRPVFVKMIEAGSSELNHCHSGARGARTRNLEIPGSTLRVAPE